MNEQPMRQGFPLWILAVVIPAVGALLMCCVGGVGFAVYRWGAGNVPAAIQPDAPIAVAPEKENPATDKLKGDVQPEQPPDLTVIFKHSPGKSIAKLVRRGSPIPDGWQGGAGRLVSIEVGQAEGQLSAMLADGKEGETATLARLR